MTRTWLTLFALLALTGQAFAGTNARLYRDIHLPTQAVLEHQAVTPAAASATALVNQGQGPTSTSTATITSFLAQPDVPRNIVITPAGTTADVGVCTVTVVGLDILGGAITETYPFKSNATLGVAGQRAFASISSVSFAASCEDSPFGAKWSVGYGEKIGLKRCMNKAGDLLATESGGVYSATRPTVLASNTSVSNNTADYNESMTGAVVFDNYFVQSFTCFP